MANHRGILLAIGYDFYRFDPLTIAQQAISREAANNVTSTKFNMDIGILLAPPPGAPSVDRKLSRKARSLYRALDKHFKVVPVGGTR